MAAFIARIASPQLRARTTLGGNLLQRPRCLYFRHPDIGCFKKGGAGCPAVSGPVEAYPGALFPGICHAGHPSDLAPVLIALDAVVELLGPNGVRTLPLAELFEGAGENPAQEASLRPGEVLVAILLPDRTRLQAFEKVAPRSANEFAWASAAMAIECRGAAIEWVRLVLGGISPGPRRCPEAEAIIAGRGLNEIEPEAVVSVVLQNARAGELHPARAAACGTAIRCVLSRITNLNNRAERINP